MRTIAILFVALVVVLGSCKKDDDPKFTSAAGTWTYTTPDSKLIVTFELKKSGTTWDAVNPTISVEGTEATAVIQATDVVVPSIGSIRINANDLKVTYPYFVLFSNLEVNGDFTQINVPSASYTWPHDKTNTLTNITITRK